MKSFQSGTFALGLVVGAFCCVLARPTPAPAKPATNPGQTLRYQLAVTDREGINYRVIDRVTGDIYVLVRRRTYNGLAKRRADGKELERLWWKDVTGPRP